MCHGTDWVRQVAGFAVVSGVQRAEVIAWSMTKSKTIRQKLAQLKKKDTTFQIFGASTHKYDLAPPVPEEQILAFEKAHQISLPTEYRAFLLEIGGGGAGPHYGLTAFAECLGHADRDEPFSLQTAFPYTNYCNVKNDDSALTPDEYRVYEAEYFHNKHIVGSIFVCHEGCGYNTLLIVSGTERGTIWLDGRVSDGGIGPLSTYHPSSPERIAPLYQSVDDKRIGFMEWYEHWLDTSLSKFI